MFRVKSLDWIGCGRMMLPRVRMPVYQAFSGLVLLGNRVTISLKCRLQPQVKTWQDSGSGSRPSSTATEVVVHSEFPMLEIRVPVVGLKDRREFDRAVLAQAFAFGWIQACGLRRKTLQLEPRPKPGPFGQGS